MTIPLSLDYLSGEGNNTLDIDTKLLNEGSYKFYVLAETFNGCKSAAVPVSFNVYEEIGPISASGKTTYCTGELAEFELISSNGFSYNWYLDEFGNIPVDSNFTTFNNGANIQFELNTPGNHILFYKGITSDGCESSIEFIKYTVNQAAEDITINIEDNRLCASTNLLKIQAGGNGIDRFEWFTNPSATVTLNDSFISGNRNDRVEFLPETTGDFSLYVRGINSSGCSSELVKVDYTVLPQPRIVNTFLNNSVTLSQFEFQSSIVFSWESENQTAYRIFKNGNQIYPSNGFENSTNNSFIISDSASVIDQGTYTVEIINQECTIRASRDLYVYEAGLKIFNTKPENETTIIDEFGDEIVYIDLDQDESIGFYTELESEIYKHTWYFGDGHINEGVNVLHYYNEEGFYDVYVEVLNTITGVTTTIELQKKVRVNKFEGAAIIDELNPGQGDSFTFFPMPVQQELHLKMNLELPQKVTLRIYNSVGIILFVEQFDGREGTNVYSWNNPLYNQPTGSYFAEISYSGKSKVFTLIKN